MTYRCIGEQLASILVHAEHHDSIMTRSPPLKMMLAFVRNSERVHVGGVAFGSDCDQRTVKSMSTEPQRTCPSCGNLSIMRGLPQLRTKSKASGARERSCLTQSLPPPTTRGTDFRFAPARRSSQAYSNLRSWRMMAHCQTGIGDSTSKSFPPAAIAWRQFFNIVIDCSSFQSWIIHFST
jgi:hypothetical protein